MKRLLIGFLAGLISLAASGKSVLAVSAEGVVQISAEDVVQNYLNVTFGGACSTEELIGIFCIIGKLINYLLLLVGAISLVMVVVGGLQYMISGGDEKAITASKSTITHAILGLFIVLLSSVIISTVLTIVGLAPSP